MNSTGYTLVVIDDEAVALSGTIPSGLSSKSPLFLGTLLMIILVGAVILGAAYIIKLHYYQSRLNTLLSAGNCDAGEYNKKSVKSIRNQITIVEGIIAEASLSGFIC